MIEVPEQTTLTDEQTFCELVRGCRHTLHAAAFAITRNEQDALDAVQEAVLRAWTKLHTLKQQAHFTTWLTRIVIHTAINMTRKRRPTCPLLVELPADGYRIEERMDIRRAIDALDEKTRLCTVLYYFEDMPIDQIAAAVGIRAGTVKSRLFRARQQLRDVLEGYQYED